jgi:protein tyrosine/serine phosphatase
VLKLFKTAEQRGAARLQRIEEWDRPLTDKAQRRKAWLNLLFIDHGVIRLAYLNRHAVTDQFQRSAQPGPHDIADFAKDGIRTVVNLRGGRENGAWPLQREACKRHDINLVELVMRSRAAPDKETLLALPAFFASLAYPVLVHCKSGADRAGLFSALYLLVHEGRPVAEAKQQLALKYGHVRLAKTGMLDAFLEAYERDGEAKGMAFLDWVEQAYDPAKVEAEFHAGFWSSLLIDKVLRRE